MMIDNGRDLHEALLQNFKANRNNPLTELYFFLDELLGAAVISRNDRIIRELIDEAIIEVRDPSLKDLSSTFSVNYRRI